MGTMPSIHPVNLVAAVLSFGACFLIPFVLEATEHEGASATQLPRDSSHDSDRGTEPVSSLDSRWLLRLPWGAGALRNVVSPAERIEAARRARFWLCPLDGLPLLGAFPAGAARPCAAQVAWTIIRAAGAAQTHHLHPVGESPRVVVVASTWFGSVAVPLVEQGALPMSTEVIGVGSVHSCDLFQGTFTAAIDYRRDRVVSCISSTGGYVLGDSMRCACVASNSCRCHADEEGATPAASALSSGNVDASHPRFVRGVPLDTFAGVEHHASGDSRRKTALLVVDVEPSSAELGFHAAVEGGRSLQAETLEYFLWILRLPTEKTVGAAHLNDKIVSLIDTWRAEGLEVAALHGDCVPSRDSSSIPTIERAPHRSDERLREFVRGGHGEATGQWYRVCALLVQSGHRARVLPLENLMREAAAAPPLNIASSNVQSGAAPWTMRLASYGLYSVAILTGLALCYGISKNWWKRRRRGQQHVSGRPSQSHPV